MTTQDQTKPTDFSAEYERLKKERNKLYEERVRWESELKSLDTQIAELDKKIKEEFGVGPEQLVTHVTTLEEDAARLIREIDELLKPAPALPLDPGLPPDQS